MSPTENGLVQVAAPRSKWSTGLFEFKRPMPLCLYAWCLPCCAAATARHEFDDSDFIFNVLTLNPVMARNMIREGYGIEGNAIEDIVLPCLLQPCVVAQLLEEVRKRGPHSKHSAGGKHEWKTGLFECDMSTCCYAYCFMPCAIAESRRKMDGSNFILNCLCSSVALNRSMIRSGYDLEGSCLMDLLISCLLPVCTVAQSLGEAKKRGKAESKAPTSARMT